MLEGQKILFRNGRINLKDYGEYFLLSYKNKKRIISQRIYKQENIREAISGFLIDIYFEYEYDHPLTIREISQLLLIEEAGTSKLLDRILMKIKNNSQKLIRY